jgi:hypothetical protein
VSVLCFDLDPLGFFLDSANRLYIVRLFVVWFETMAVSLYVNVSAVSSAKVADVVSGEIGRSAVNNRYSNGSRTLPWSQVFWVWTQKFLFWEGPQPTVAVNYRSILS